jgi:hypothetical protein
MSSYACLSRTRGRELAQAVDAGWLHPIGLAGVVIWAVRVRSYLGS